MIRWTTSSVSFKYRGSNKTGVKIRYLSEHFRLLSYDNWKNALEGEGELGGIFLKNCKYPFATVQLMFKSWNEFIFSLSFE